MKTGSMLIIAILVWFVGFALGYTISAKTGTEPGYFEAVEAAGYGGGSELEGAEGLSEDMLKYYQEISEE
ncbi:MAG: hypothetical protein GXO99_03760 [Nitrospirae bacterium]|nr:hypothetical protein [Nitrospirota bacterium]